MTPIEGRTPIVEEHVILVFPSGERRTARIAICAPEPDPSPDIENDDTWVCWWYLEHLWNRPIPTCGCGSLQPLMLALQAIGYAIHGFIEHGGRVMSNDEEPGWAGELLTLRVLLRRPRDPYPADPVLADLDAELAESARRYEEDLRNEE